MSLQFLIKVDLIYLELVLNLQIYFSQTQAIKKVDMSTDDWPFLYVL